MTTILIILALLAAALGFFNASEATFGVAIIGIACLLGILARISQASDYQDQVKDLLKRIEESMPEVE